MYPTWINGPLGPGHERRLTRSGCRTVLVMVPHMVAGTRLADLLPLIESDHRVQAVFTVPETTATWHHTKEFVRAQGGLLLPWHQALQHEFDLVLAASRSFIDAVQGPVLVTSHGAGTIRSRLRSRKAGPAAVPQHDLARETLTSRGRVIPAALVLTHDDELAVLRDSCPEALPTAVVAGDLCLDRIHASLPYRDQYRQALGVSDEQHLVMVSSTWSTGSIFGDLPDLYYRLVDELPAERYRVVTSLHPNVWTVHGHRQVRAWLSDYTRRGLLVLPPEEGWRAALVAADVVLGDYGSATQYGAALGIPTLLAAFPDGNIRSGSPAEVLAQTAPRVSFRRSLDDQIQTTLRQPGPALGAHLHPRLTSRPGKAGGILRRRMYELLRLTEPARAVPVAPLPLPRPLTDTQPDTPPEVSP